MVSSDYRFSRWARGLLFFFLIKRTKNQDSKEVSFRSGPCRTKPAEPGLQPFALLRSLSPPLLQKLLCPALFCPLFGRNCFTDGGVYSLCPNLMLATCRFAQGPRWETLRAGTNCFLRFWPKLFLLTGENVAMGLKPIAMIDHNCHYHNKNICNNR